MPISTHLTARIARLAEQPVADMIPVQGGYTPALRLRVTLQNGRSVFAKVGTNPYIAGELRREHHVYTHLRGDFMPEMLGWEDDFTQPILLLEDLSAAHWPPPWQPGQVKQVLDTLPQIWQTAVPHLKNLADYDDLLNSWQQVAQNPAPFLSLQLASSRWLEAALPQLLAVDGVALAQGNDFLHLDMRSDNLCLADNRVIFVDWNHACYGNGRLDLGFLLPSLAAEGGPPPEAILPNAADIATVVSGFFAARAGLPLIADAPYVRHIQLVQLKEALPWVVRAYALPPLDGHMVL